MQAFFLTLFRWMVFLGVTGFALVLFVMASMLIEAPVLPDFTPYFAFALTCVALVGLGLGGFLFLDLMRK